MLLSSFPTLAALAVSVAATPANITKRQGGVHVFGSCVGTCNSSTNSLGVQVIGNCYEPGQVAMTFDDPLGLKEYELDIAQIMEGSGGLGTFFVNGLNREGTGFCIYDRAQDLKSLYNRGHIIASHSWSHHHMPGLDEGAINVELEKLETSMIKILGVKPKYFRPPHGEYNELMLKILSQRGYTKMFLWTDETRDWVSDLNYQKDIIDGVVNAYPGPRTLLQHPPYEFTNRAVRYGAQRLAARGYRIVTLDDCTGGGGAYTYIGAPQARDSTWVC